MNDTHRSSLLLTGLALGVLADLLFWDRFTGSLGVYGPAWAVFAVVLLIALFVYGRQAAVQPTIGSRLLLMAVLLLSAAPALRSALPVAVGSLMASVAFGILAARYFRGPALTDEPAISFVLGLGLTPLAMAVRAASSVPSLGRIRDAAATAGPGLGPVLRGLVLAIPFLILFTGLLASADQVFEGYVEQVISLDILDVLGEPIGHMVFVTLVGGLAIGWLHRAMYPGDPKTHRVRDWFDWLGSPKAAKRGDVESTSRAEDAGGPGADSPGADSPEEILIHGSRRFLSIGIGEGLTVLTLIDALFAVFVMVQFAYLFGGAVDLGEGLSYSEYARRGFFELVAVTVLCGGTLVLMADLTRRAAPRHRRWFNVLGTLLLLLLGVVLASAFYRMRLYELAFGYTRLRLLVYVFIGWLGVGLGALAWSLWTQPRRIVATALALVAAFALTATVINPDAVIARRNIERYSNGEELDFVYLSQLSDDAVPVVVEAFDRLPAAARVHLAEDYRARWERLREAPSRRPGMDFNLGSWRAWQALQDERFEADGRPVSTG